jgi:hypothetical protein
MKIYLDNLDKFSQLQRETVNKIGLPLEGMVFEGCERSIRVLMACENKDVRIYSLAIFGGFSSVAITRDKKIFDKIKRTLDNRSFA